MPEQTSAGETGGREAMSDERLAEIQHLVYAIDLPGGAYPSLTRELLAEVERLRDLNAELSETLDVRHDETQQAKAGAKTAEHALAEMRERIGEERDVETRAVDAALTAWAVGDQAKLNGALLGLREVFICRIADLQVRDRHAAESRVVGERKAADGG